MAYITCKDLTLGYEGHAIVSDLNFKVSKGDYLCIVGENGTGKSTLIKTLLPLQDAISGEIIPGDGLKAYEVGYLPQQTVVQKDFRRRNCSFRHTCEMRLETILPKSRKKAC